MPSTTRTLTTDGYLVRPFELQGQVIPSTFTYDTGDPLAVTLDITDRGRGGKVIPWRFARDLLHPTIGRSIHSGDVSATWTSDGLVVVAFVGEDAPGSPEWSSSIAYSADRIRWFLNETYSLVERGAERVDFDAELDALLKRSA